MPEMRLKYADIKTATEQSGPVWLALHKIITQPIGEHNPWIEKWDCFTNG